MISTTKLEEPGKNEFDKRTFYGALVLYFAALVNPRDFPIHNVPLLYPAFVVYIFLIAPGKILEGMRRTKLLWGLLLIYWLYFSLLRVFFMDLPLYSSAYIIEPCMLIVAAGMGTIRVGGLRASLRALLLVVTFSAACGLWIYFIGEPFSSFRDLLQQYVSGNPFGTWTEMPEKAIVSNNAGLSLYTFSFSYQLAIAIAMSLSSVFYFKKVFNTSNIAQLFIIGILLLGAITNAERAIVVSAAFAMLILMLRRKALKNSSKFIAICTFIVIAILINLLRSTELTGASLFERFRSDTSDPYLRVFTMPLAAIKSVLYEPLGSGGFSKYYEQTAYSEGWLYWDGNILAAHNHYANIIMYTGLIGIAVVAILFWQIYRRVRMLGKNNDDVDSAILTAASTCAIAHAFMHNAGFFNLEPTTEIVLGLLWGATFFKREGGYLRRRNTAFIKEYGNTG